MNAKIIRQTNTKITAILQKQDSLKLEVTSEKGDVYEYDYLRQRSSKFSEQTTTSKILQVGYTSDIKYILSSDHSLKFYNFEEKIFEMPINTLNFSNIIVFPQSYDLLVICVSTTDPDKFDVYKISNILTSEKKNVAMIRLLRLQGFTEQKLHTGNIMNFECVKNILFVGYEDGSLIRYLFNNEFNEILEMNVVFDFERFGNETHEDRDHPVLKIEYCIEQNAVFFTHAKVAEIYYYRLDDFTIEKALLPENISINHIVSINDSVYFSCWENNFIYKLDSQKNITVFYSISIKPNIQLVDIDPVADTSELHPYKDLDRTPSKVSCMYKVSKDDIQHQYLGLESKVLMKRFSKVIQNDYLYIGLESGNLIELSF